VNHLLRDLAPVNDAAWSQIEAEAAVPSSTSSPAARR
jgi:uncharacterized linocin/CFP29 family protein